MKFLIYFFVCFQFINSADSEESKNVLVFLPVTGHSHLKFMSTVAHILQDEGYNVTLLMPMIDETLANLTPLAKQIKHRIVLPCDPRTQEMVEKAGGSELRQITWGLKSGVQGFITHKKMLTNLYRYACDNLFHNSETLKYLQNQNFHIGLSEPFFVCGFALFDHLNITKTMSIDSHIGVENANVAHGDAITSSFLPAAFSSGTDRMGFLERGKNFVENYFNFHFTEYINEWELEMIKDVYKKKNWKELLRMNAFIFLNSNPLLDFPFPHTSKFINVGGIAADEEDRKDVEKLPEFYDRALSLRNSTVLISFGSNAKSIFMPEQMKLSLINAFEAMPDTTFIWKYENTSVDIVKKFNSKINNVFLTEWMPQPSLLADPRLTLFITHGGLGSTNEVAFSGKPAIMVPVFGDQTRNARMLERHGTAVLLRKEDLLDWRIIKTAISKILNDENYTKNAKQLALLLKNSPESPKQTFLKYFNFVAKYGKPNGIDSYAAEMGTIEYYFLDWLLLLIFIFCFVTLVTFKIVFFAFNSFRSRDKIKVE